MPEGGTTASRTPVGEGREAQIYAWDAGTVLRLPRPTSRWSQVEHEAVAMRAAAAAGVPVPRVHGTTTQDGRDGLIMDRVDGPDLITLMGKRPWTVPSAARMVGAVQASLHGVVAPNDLPRVHDVARFKIQTADKLPVELAEFALAMLDDLPDGDRLCHGDFHPGNVLVGKQGPAVIDWTDAARGDPAADLARTRLLLREGAVQEHMPAVIKLMMRHMHALGRGAFFRLYARAYARARAIDADLVHRWEIVRAADRVREGIEDEIPALLELLKRRAAART
jgi:aminoglycoside phosphotransferase (APT) family kinase protein